MPSVKLHSEKQGLAHALSPSGGQGSATIKRAAAPINASKILDGGKLVIFLAI